MNKRQQIETESDEDFDIFRQDKRNLQESQKKILKN